MSPQDALLDLQCQIYRECKAGGRPVAQLVSWLFERRNLEAAWDRVRSADGANTPGTDGVTAAEINGRTNQWLAKLSDDLFHESYQPTRPRFVDVPKGSGEGTRRLGILTIRDRVVHAAIKQVLEPILEPVFHPGSFGFRPGRSVAGALARATHFLRGEAGEALRYQIALHLDVADCFDTIDHELLMEQVGRHVSDEAVLRLVRKLLQVGGTTVRRLWRSRSRGVVQGGALSPLLCNLYLHELDECLAQLGRATQGGIQPLRYADDVLVLARDASVARQALKATKQTLARLRQRLRDRKSRMCPVHEGFDWLGVRMQPRQSRWTGKITFGYTVPDKKVLEMLDRISEMTTPPSSRIDASAFDLGRWVVSVNDQLREWRQAYVYADNAAEVFHVIDDHTQERVAELMHSITGRRRSELYSQYRVRLPRGFSTWQIGGTRLVVLSSLAPHFPCALTRRPPWQRDGRNKHRPAVPLTETVNVNRDTGHAGSE